MAKVVKGRYAAELDGKVVVFLIGMRVNRFWQFWKWVPVALEMPAMLKELFAHPEKGFLHVEFFFSWRTVLLVQYWRSFEDLERFARSKDDPHLAAWRRFNQRVGTNGSVGIFHETYEIEPGKVEAIYGNMPVFGLAKATKHVPAVGKRETARRRMGGGENAPAVESPASNDRS